MHLSGGFIYQWQHRFERKLVCLKQMLADGVHVVAEVAGKDSCYVQVFSLFRTGFVHFRTKASGYFLKKGQVLRRIGFEEKWHFFKINFPLFAESLHGVSYSVIFEFSLPYFHWHTSSSVQVQSIRITVGKL